MSSIFCLFCVVFIIFADSTKVPSINPTRLPSRKPIPSPSKKPTRSPSKKPTRSPSTIPTKSPSRRPTFIKVPSAVPSKTPSRSPTSSSSVSFTIEKTQVAVGDVISCQWKGISSVALDWIGLYAVGASNTPSLCEPRWLDDACISGLTYEFRYFCCDGYNVKAYSAPISVPKSPTIRPTISPTSCVSFSILSNPVIIGAVIEGSWIGPPAKAYDWIGVYPVGAIAGTVTSLWWMYVNTGSTGGTFKTSDGSASWIVPSGIIQYEVRYFCCDGYTVIATSNKINVQSSPPVIPQCRDTSTTSTTNPTTASNIKHLLVIITENHSFDNFFGRYCQAKPYSNPTCNYGQSCCEAAPDIVSGILPITLSDSQNLAFDPAHGMSAELCEVNNGLMDKFMSGQGCSGSNDKNFAISDEKTLTTYYSYARKYVIADRHFQSSCGASSQNDMYFARGAFVFSDNSYVPNSVRGTSCYTDNYKISYTDSTITDLLNYCNVPWSVYIEGYDINPSTSSQCWPYYYDASDIPFAYYPTLADKPSYFKDYNQLYTDVTGGTLPAVSYFKALGIHSEHPGDSTLTDGQTFADNIVQAILQSPLYSSNTVIIITQDESGGYYDHVHTPADNPIDQRPYGARTPFIAVGNMVKQNYVSHVQIETSSIIKFIEWNWLAGGTGQLGTRDTNVNNLGDIFDHSKTGFIPSD